MPGNSHVPLNRRLVLLIDLAADDADELQFLKPGVRVCVVRGTEREEEASAVKKGEEEKVELSTSVTRSEIHSAYQRSLPDD